MSFQTLQQGIDQIRAGHLQEGARLIRIALNDPNIQGGTRAVANMWLVETTQHNNEKLYYLQQALGAAQDPNLRNDIQQRITGLIAADLPPDRSTGTYPTITPPPARDQHRTTDSIPQFGGNQGGPQQRPPANPGGWQGQQGGGGFNFDLGPNPGGGQRQPGGFDFDPRPPDFDDAQQRRPQYQPQPRHTPQPSNNRRVLDDVSPNTFSPSPYSQTGGYPGSRDDLFHQRPGTGPLNQDIFDTGPQQAVPGTGRLNPANLPGTGQLPRLDEFGLGDTGEIPTGGYTPANYRVPDSQIVGVIGGPNGPGSAFFVSTEGLLATTRYVVGTATTVTLDLGHGQQVQAKVVRSFPALDLALIRAKLTVPNVRPITPFPEVPPNTVLTVESYDGQTAATRCRSTKRNVKPHWFPTETRTSLGSGGTPVFDERQHLTGMLTRNVDRSNGLLYGLHIHEMLRRIEEYNNDLRGMRRHVYCPTCGNLSQAGAEGLHYCETCGDVLPHAARLRRVPQPNGAFYYDRGDKTCTFCGATAGFYKNRCLRCDRSIRENINR